MRLWIAATCALSIASPAAAQNWLSLSREQTEQAFAPAAAPEPARPDPIMTPGAVDPTLTADRLCHESSRHRRPPSTKLCDRVFAAYSIPESTRYQYECDHAQPVCLGGKTVEANLWPQPNTEAERKDRLETALCVAVCRGEIPLAQAQREIAEDWVAAERRYMGR